MAHSSPMALLELRDVTVDYGAGRPALDGVSLAVGEGELVTVVGPSGCGKSTLLRVIAGLVRPSRGDVFVAGQRVTEREPGERDIALVFQSYALYPHMTVRGNLEFPLRMQRADRAIRAARVAEVAELLALTPLLDRRPHELSGGQMQRVAIGRALVRRPKAFLLDEPLSNLDPRLAEDVRAELRALFRRLGATVLYVTHDHVGAVTLGDRLCVLGEGRVQALDRPLELVSRPPSVFVADLLGAPPLNLVRGRVTAGVFRAGGLAVDAAGSADGELVLGLAPQELALQSRADAPPGGGTAPCRVLDVERTGARTVARVRISEAEGAGAAWSAPGTSPTPLDLRVALTGDHALAPEDKVTLDARGATRHWFDAASGRRR